MAEGLERLISILDAKRAYIRSLKAELARAQHEEDRLALHLHLVRGRIAKVDRELAEMTKIHVQAGSSSAVRLDIARKWLTNWKIGCWTDRVKGGVSVKPTQFLQTRRHAVLAALADRVNYYPQHCIRRYIFLVGGKSNARTRKMV